jgi:hypothetical protein
VITDKYDSFPSGMFVDCYFCKNRFMNIRPNLGCRRSIEVPLSETFGVYLIDGEPENEGYFARETRLFAKPLSVIYHFPLFILYY